MKVKKITLNLPGINRIMKSEGIQSVIQSSGNSVANIAGNEYAASIKVGRWLAFCNVYPDSKDAAHENYTENTLLKALGSSGLKLTKGAGR